MTQRKVLLQDAGHQVFDELTDDDLATPPGGGAVDSVNGQIGVVVLDAGDVGADTAAARDTAIGVHAGLSDPHPGYLTPAEGNAAYDAIGAAAAAAAASQPVDSDLAAIAALTTTSYGRAFLALADAAAARTALGLGTAALSASGDFQPIDSDLTAIAALTTTSYGRSLLEAANAAALRTLAGLGTAAVAATGDFEAAGAVATHAAAGDPHAGYQLESGLAAAITATKLDDLASPDDNSDLNATTGAHGLLPKLGGGSTNFLRADGTWNAPAGGGSVTKRVPIALDTPDATGNAYPALSTNNGFTNVRRVVPAFTKDVLGTWEGAVRIPADYASAGKVVISLVANATANVFRSIVSTAVVAATVTEDTAYTDEAAVDTTFATTAKRRVDVTVTLTTTPVANSTLNVKITHDGAHANDTLAVDCLVWECLFEYTT